MTDTAMDETPEQFYARLPTTRGAAGALLLDDAGRILLVRRAYSTAQPWGIPGGIIERSESPLAACLREIREELAVDPVIEHLAAVDWVPPRPPKTAANMWLFTGTVPAEQYATIRLDPAELTDWAWITPVQVPTLLPEHAARRVAAALQAAADKRTAYLEDGRPPR